MKLFDVLGEDEAQALIDECNQRFGFPSESMILLLAIQKLSNRIKDLENRLPPEREDNPLGERIDRLENELGLTPKTPVKVLKRIL